VETHHDELVKFKTRGDKKKAKRIEFHKTTMKKVSAYIVPMMIQWQEKDCIWAGRYTYVSFVAANIGLLTVIPSIVLMCHFFLSPLSKEEQPMLLQQYLGFSLNPSPHISTYASLTSTSPLLAPF
jgi:hypothetical protein